MTALEVQIHESWATVPATAWDALVGEDSPFTRHAWLDGMERTGCATEATGWSPRPLLVTQGGRIVGGAPCWLRHRSDGEYVWDRPWQEACDRASLPYFPKATVAVPWTPSTGQRLFFAPGAPVDEVRKALVAAMQQLGATGIHVLFPRDREIEGLEELGYFRRHQWQYHWKNLGYRSYTEFLTRFKSRHRKAILRERRAVSDLRFTTEVAPSPAIVAHLYDCWLATCTRYGETPPVPRAFFEHIAHAMPASIVAVVAWDGTRPVAGALNVQGASRLYGRYWGSLVDRPFLHFEVCYHRGIEWCIDQGLRAFEPGHGGEHKLRRGFEPAQTWSVHGFADAQVHEAFARYGRREAQYLERQREALRRIDPLDGR